MTAASLAEKLTAHHILSRSEFTSLIDGREETGVRAMLKDEASSVSRSVFGNAVYTRGLIEFTNVCRNNCYYCGIRAGNTEAERYRLSQNEILSCCASGYVLGFRTFVLQGGEDPY